MHYEFILVSLGLNTLQRRIQILAVRIDDEHIRDGVDALIGRVKDSLTVKKADRAWQVGSQAAKEFGNLNSRIGEELRLLAAQRIEGKPLVHGPTSTPS